MPHAYSDTLKNHLGGDATTLALLWRITRKDGAVYAFTDHSHDIEYDGTVYKTAGGFTPSTLEQAEKLSVDNAELSGIFTVIGITQADVRSGEFDGAEVEIYHINYAAPSGGAYLRAKGTIGEVTLEGGRYKAEFRSLMEKLQQPVGRLITPSCDALLGDSRCSVSLAACTFTASVTAVTNNIRFSAASLTQANAYFKNGKITFTSGNNNGVSREVKTFRSGVIELALPLIYDVAVSDGFTIIAGCDKSSVACSDKFNNLVNFRGFPDVPGQDRVLRVYS